MKSTPLFAPFTNKDQEEMDREALARFTLGRNEKAFKAELAIYLMRFQETIVNGFSEQEKEKFPYK